MIYMFEWLKAHKKLIMVISVLIEWSRKVAETAIENKAV